MSASEFQSVILTVDHTSLIPGDHTIQKFVASTEDATEALISNINYFNDHFLLNSVETIKQLQEVGRASYPCILYRAAAETAQGPQPILQIILSAATYALIVERSESILDATTFILNEAGRVISALDDLQGFAPIHVLDWSEEAEEFTPEGCEPEPPLPKKRARKARK